MKLFTDSLMLSNHARLSRFRFKNFLGLLIFWDNFVLTIWRQFKIIRSADLSTLANHLTQFIIFYFPFIEIKDILQRLISISIVHLSLVGRHVWHTCHWTNSHFNRLCILILEINTFLSEYALILQNCVHVSIRGQLNHLIVSC